VERLTTQQDENSIDIFVENKQAISDITACTVQHDLQVLAIEVKEPNLETLFLQLTGRSLRD
jgi:ABC-2 type transport system ATP-binding protein